MCTEGLFKFSLSPPPSGLQVHRSEGLIYMVLEFGDIDLARLLQVSQGDQSAGWALAKTLGGSQLRGQRHACMQAGRQNYHQAGRQAGGEVSFATWLLPLCWGEYGD